MSVGRAPGWAVALACALGTVSIAGCRGDDEPPPDVFYDFEASGHFPDGAAPALPDVGPGPDATDAAGIDAE